tara:strand:- start:207 stop:395 length:189 start_codon:yes stop_codon:yes gene_type:complete
MKATVISWWLSILAIYLLVFCLEFSAWSLEFTEWQKLDEPVGEGVQSVAFSSTVTGFVTGFV